MKSLYEEIDRLPERLRAPVVLFHLEGRTYDEAARALRVPVTTVRGRLARARARLAARLIRRGVAGVLLAATLGTRPATADEAVGAPQAALAMRGPWFAPLGGLVENRTIPS